MFALNRVSWTSVAIGTGLVLAGCVSPIDETDPLATDEVSAALEQKPGEEKVQQTKPGAGEAGEAPPGFGQIPGPQQLPGMEKDEGAAVTSASDQDQQKPDDATEEGNVGTKSDAMGFGVPGPFYGGGYYGAVPGVVVGPGVVPPFGFGYGYRTGMAWGQTCGLYGCVFW